MKILSSLLKKLFALAPRNSEDAYLTGCADIYELEYRMRNLDRSRRAHTFQLYAVR
jgi:hypothetical protein